MPVQNQSTAASLRDIMEDYIVYPNADYTLRYFATSNIKSGSSKHGF